MQDIVSEAGGHACSAVAMRVCFPFPAPLILVSLKSCASRVWRFAPSPAVAPSGPLGLALEALGPTGSVGLGLLFAFIGPAAHSSQLRFFSAIGIWSHTATHVSPDMS